MEKKYWIVDDKNVSSGPYNFDDLRKKKVLSTTFIWMEGLENWVSFSSLEDYKLYNDYLAKRTRKSTNHNINKKSIIIGFLITIVITLSGLVYKQYQLTNDEAKDMANKLFYSIRTNNIDYKLISDFYPEFNNVGSLIILNPTPTIDRVSDAGSNQKIVFATFQNHPLTVIVSKEKFKSKIVATQGLSAHIYNKVAEFGIAKGCLKTSLFDHELNRAVKEQNLQEIFNETLEIAKVKYKANISYTDNLTNQFGNYLNGKITISNKNFILMDHQDAEVFIDFYDSSNKFISASKEHLLIDIKPLSSQSIHVFRSIPTNAASYEVRMDYNISNNVKNSLIEQIIRNNENTCF